MINFYSIWLIFLSTVHVNNIPQTERGNLILPIHPQAISYYVTNNKINLEHVRETCNFLTNNDIAYYEGNLIPRRKNAFIRHIKHLNEQLEQAYLDDKIIDESILEILYELTFFEASLKQKTIQSANSKVTFKDKVKIQLHTNKSNRVFRYKNVVSANEAINIDPMHLQNDPSDSPYWHNIDTFPLNEQFDHLARLKKIKTKKNMVVLFDKLSLDGSAPKIDALDLDLDNKWSLKWGDEVHTDIAGSRIFAALGYDVDHPYFYGEDKLTLIFNDQSLIKNAADLNKSILDIYNIDLTSFISSSGIINAEMATLQTNLEPFVGKQFIRFKKCGLEARPDRVKRIGSFLPEDFNNEGRRELRGALLAHQFIGNWDTREENTLLTLVHMGNYNYRMSAAYSDLGTSFGVIQNIFPADFKVGLVNEFPWEVAELKNNSLHLNSPVNAILTCYKEATYQDLLWMANKIALIDSVILRDIVNAAHWPEPVEELYFHKLASRRASILSAFNITDLHPIIFNKHLDVEVNGILVIKDGVLLFDFERNNNPESFITEKGRFRNYGN